MHRYGEHINGYQRGWGLEGKVGKEGQLYGKRWKLEFLW